MITTVTRKALLAVATLLATLGLTAGPAAAEPTQVHTGWGYAADTASEVWFRDRARDGHCVYVQISGSRAGVKSSAWSCGGYKSIALRSGDTKYRICRTGSGGYCSNWIRTLRAQGKA